MKMCTFKEAIKLIICIIIIAIISICIACTFASRNMYNSYLEEKDRYIEELEDQVSSYEEQLTDITIAVGLADDIKLEIYSLGNQLESKQKELDDLNKQIEDKKNELSKLQ